MAVSTGRNIYTALSKIGKISDWGTVQRTCVSLKYNIEQFDVQKDMRSA